MIFFNFLYILTFLKKFNCFSKQGKKIEFLHETELSTLQNLADALEIVYVGTVRLGKDHVDLGTTDKILQFILVKLSNLNNNPFSEILYREIKKRVKERRNSMMHYLCGILNRDIHVDDHSNFFDNPGFESAIGYAESLYLRLFGDEEAEKSEIVEIPPQSMPLESFETKTLAEELQELISKKGKYNGYSFTNSFINFQTTGILDARLQKLKSAINSVQPSSILPERLFSLAGNFIRVRRNRIQPDLLDSLMILKCNI